MFLEAVIALIALIFFGSVLLGLFKLVFALVLIPLKLFLLLTKGLLGLVLLLPLLLLGGLLLGAALPLLLLVILAPIWILGGVTCAFLA